MPRGCSVEERYGRERFIFFSKCTDFIDIYHIYMGKQGFHLLGDRLMLE